MTSDHFFFQCRRIVVLTEWEGSWGNAMDFFSFLSWGRKTEKPFCFQLCNIEIDIPPLLIVFLFYVFQTLFDPWIL